MMPSTIEVRARRPERVRPVQLGPIGRAPRRGRRSDQTTVGVEAGRGQPVQLVGQGGGPVVARE